MASKKTSLHKQEDDLSYNKWDEASSDTEEDNYESIIEAAGSRISKSKKTTQSSGGIAKRSTRKNSSPKIDLGNRSSLTGNRSARDSAAAGPTKATKSKKKSKSKVKEEVDLTSLVNNEFHYELKDCDHKFLEFLFAKLPEMIVIWDRIGFNEVTKLQRLDNFYTQLMNEIEAIVENEEELEAKIIDTISEQKRLLVELCHEMSIKYDELKSVKAKNLTMIDQEELLREETRRLGAEKKRRLEDYKRLATSESTLCEKLGEKKTVLRANVPSETDINNLKKRCQELDEVYHKRKAEMNAFKETIMSLTEDLEVSRSDSFAELIVFESIDELPLSERDLVKAAEFCEELERKNRDALDQIRSLRTRIKELWSKLNIENSAIKPMLQDTNPNNEQLGVISKRTLISELTKEYDRCVQIKMENMQKFIESIRSEIRELTAKMYFGDKEMKALAVDLLSSTDYTEQLLTRHEEKLEDLKFRYEEFESLYEKVGRWMRLWQEFVQFEEKTKDPQRFKQRGYNMLEEEKQRKTFNNQLPKLEEELGQLAVEYRNTNGGQHFTIQGMKYDEFIHVKRVDYEEGKELEKREKQIMRDTMKKNESRFGSKPMTPLALRNKRKLNANSNQDTQLTNTPGAMHRSKLQRTDMTQASVNQTPGSSRLFAQNVQKGKPAVSGISKAGRITNPKRKSRTPGKNRYRRSKILANQSKASAASGAGTNESDQGNSTLKTTTLSSVASSMYQSSTTMSTTNLSTQSSASMKLSKMAMSSKYPPIAASSKFASSTCITRMTSTASNTFIEEENIDLVENSNAIGIASAAAAAIAKMSEAEFKPKVQKFNTCDVNYFEFSRDLPKPFKPTQQLADSTNFAKPSRLAAPSRLAHK